VWAEAGMKFRVWKWFRFSCKAEIEIRGVGQDPSYGLASIRIRIETPWYLPDVTFKYSWTIGQLSPEELAASRRPLTSAGGFQESTGASYPLYLTPLDASASDDRDRVRSIEEFREIITAPRAARVAAAFTGTHAVAPAPTDVTLQLSFAVPVTDTAGLASPVPQATGEQASGDLTLKLELIGMTIRRRKRFDDSAPWLDLCERIEMNAILDGSGGFSMGGLDPLPLSAFWEPVLVDSQTAAQRLLLNATTPFSYGTWDPNSDEELVDASPGWPCCTPRHEQSWPTHELTFADQPLGDPLSPATRFTGTRSTLHAVRAADVRLSIHAGVALPAGTRAARWNAAHTGIMFRIVLDKPAAWVDLYPAWPAQVGGAVVLSALDENDEVIKRVELPLGTARPPQRQRLAATRPIASIVVAARTGLVIGAPFVELTRASYVAYSELEAGARQQVACKFTDHGALSGQGKIGFLPNHEYEIELRTRLTMGHPSTTPEAVETTEFAYFRTKGLPGLNAVADVGAEVRPHVASEYPDAAAPLYREEPVVIAFDDKYSVAVPLASRPPRPASPERDVLLELELTVRPTIARETGTPFTASSPDWLTAHRIVAPLGRPSVWRDVLAQSATVGRKDVTTDQRRMRLAALVAHPEACDIGNPLVTPSGVLVAPPPEDLALGVNAWPAQAGFDATISPKGGAQGPFVHREAFDPADLTALSFADDAGPVGSAAWSVLDGVLTRAGAGRQLAALGNELWNYFTVEVAVAVTDAAAGVALALPVAAAGATRGLFALIERDGGTTFLALRRRRTAGAPLEVLARTEIEVSDGPIALSVTAFDDRVRAQVGQVVVEAEREELRDGCLALVADGAAAFHTLSVAGMPMYRFPIKTSRYRTFADHIASYNGVLGEVSPESLGLPAIPTTAVTTLYASTVTRVAQAMTAAADATTRDALFSEWVAALSLPLRSDPSGLELTRYVIGGDTRLLLLEGPEPLRFTHEIQLGLTPLTGGWHPPDWLDDLRDAILTSAEARVTLPRFTRPMPRNVAVVRAGSEPGELRVFTGRMEKRRGGGTFVRARRAADVRVFDPSLLPALATLRPGGVALVDLDLLDVLGEVYPVDPLPLPPQPPPTFAVLTDGPQQRAIFVPVRTGVAVALDAGRWRLDFAFDRMRWREATPSPAAHLTATASLVIGWA